MWLGRGGGLQRKDSAVQEFSISSRFSELGELLRGESGWGIWVGRGSAAQSGDLQAGRGRALGSSERGREEWERTRVGTLAGRFTGE